MAFLDARGIPLTPDQRARTLATLDLTVLNTWLVRAATCTTAAEVFAD